MKEELEKSSELAAIFVQSLNVCIFYLKTSMTRLILFSTILFYTSCTSTNRQNQAPNQDIDVDSTKTIFDSNVQEARLGESNYFILLPDKFEISEARGKEGQLCYNIIPKDTSSTMFGFIEIRQGNPIGDISLYDTQPNEIITAHLLDKKVEWKVYKTETGYFDASTNEKGDLNAHASTKNRNEIDSLISIISTLRQK